LKISIACSSPKALEPGWLLEHMKELFDTVARLLKKGEG